VYHGFSATCTHRGCTVNRVSGGMIRCPCHGSQFSIEDGSVKAGPAPKPLPRVPLKVKNGEISVA
jgi:Rieske Fe-S protein